MHSEVNERAEEDVVHWNKRKCGERGGGGDREAERGCAGDAPDDESGGDNRVV